jgi:glycosyltransferase involved in cell wall biosynthesis
MAIQSLAIFTICSNNYVPFAKVLVESAQRYHPEATLYLCLADERLAEPGWYPQECEVVAAEELRIPDFRNFAFRYDIMELNTAVKPYMVRHLLTSGHDAVLYFDPDIELFAPLDGILAPLHEGASFVFTPHLCQPSEGDAFPDDVGIMRAGVYNLGFLGVGAGTQTDRLMRWWSRRLLYQCVSEQDRGIFVDQKFMDLVPGFADNVRIVRDTAYNLAYWNLPQRTLTQDGKHWRVDGKPLGFFHFSGIDPENLARLSKYTTAFQGAAIMPTLRALMHQYADQVLASGYGTVPRALYAYGRFASGMPIPDLVRRMFRERHLFWGGDPFETFEEYLHLPIAEQWAGSAACMTTNLMADLRRREPWLAATFDPKCQKGTEAYTEWFINHGHTLLQEPRLIEPVAERAARRNRSGRAVRPVPAQRAPNEPDVSVVGYLRLALGIGEAGRQTLRALGHAGFNAQGLPIQLNSNSARVDDSLEPLLDDAAASARVQVFNVNADQVPQVVAHLGEKLRPDAYRILVPFWELANLPDAWLGAFDLVDEVWAPTRFIQTTLVRKVMKPIFRMPLLLDFKAPAPAPRAKFGLPEHHFLFFFAFDFFSFVERKNPMAVVRAFKSAFRRSMHNLKVGLVLKTLNGTIVPEKSAAVRDELRDDPDVTLIERTLTREETLQLINSCDAVASLHRSEGLGLLIAEAMALGKPVIATDYSGTTELVTARTGYPVDYKLVPVQEGEYPFHEGQVWADADVNHAAWLMRRVFDDRAGAIRRVDAARRHLTENYSLQACSRRIRERLHTLERM